MSEEEVPAEAVAVSPVDQSSDREQSDADQAVNVTAIAALAERTEELIETNRILADAHLVGLEREKTASFRFRLSMLVLGLLTLMAGVSIIVLLVLAQQSREELIRSAEVGEANRGAAVVRIGEATAAASAAAAACAQAHAGYVAIKACVDRTLAAK